MSKCCGGLVVTGGDFGSIGHRFESWWWQSNFSLYIGDWNSSVKWREYFGSYLFAAKIPGTLAGNKTRNVSSNCRWEPAHNAIWPKFFRKLKTVFSSSKREDKSLPYISLFQQIITLVEVLLSSVLYLEVPDLRLVWWTEVRLLSYNTTTTFLVVIRSQTLGDKKNSPFSTKLESMHKLEQIAEHTFFHVFLYRTAQSHWH